MDTVLRCFVDSAVIKTCLLSSKLRFAGSVKSLFGDFAVKIRLVDVNCRGMKVRGFVKVDI